MPLFRDLHRPGDPFVLANAWDVGSARLLVAAGHVAIGTTSAGHAFTRGLPDGGRVGRDEAVAHAADLAAHVPVPVSADLEDGFGPEPADAFDAVAAAARAGLAGCSIEDVDGNGEPYSLAAAVARIEVAVMAAREAGHDHVLCARADGVMHGAYDLAEAIERLQAFEAAGADVLYCPAPGGPDALRRVVEAVGRPVNALAAGPFLKLTRRHFAEIGVARISLGSSLARRTHAVIRDQAAAMMGGDFSGLGGAAGPEIDALLARGAGDA